VYQKKEAFKEAKKERKEGKRLHRPYRAKKLQRVFKKKTII
jgi:hypothetical protein